MLYCSSEWKWKTGEHLQARKGDFDLDWYLAVELTRGGGHDMINNESSP